MKNTAKKTLALLLCLVMMLGLLPGMGLTAYADDPYASIKNTTTAVHFDNKNWYLIDYDASTVTLLSKECVGVSTFGSNNTYSGSTVEAYVNSWYTNNISADAKTAVSGGMYLLTTAQANDLTDDIRKCSKPRGVEGNAWWLSSPSYNGTNGTGRAAFEAGAACVRFDTGSVSDNARKNLNTKLGVRPALKLNLSSVIFSSESNTFSLKPAGYNVTITAGSNMTKTTESGAASQTDLSGAMTDVVYTADDGYYFPEFTNITDNGITATRTNETTVTVSGTPTANASITIPDAVLAHTHSFTYSAEGDTITATCNGTGTCDITEGLTLTISAPTGDLTADGTTTFPASLSTGYNTTAFPGEYPITYTKDGQPFDGTPTEAGEYTASVTVGDATASVSYTVTAPTVAVTDVSLDKTDITIPVGSAEKLTATVIPGDATNKKVKWSVDGDAGIVALYYDENCTQTVTLDAETDTLEVYAKGLAAGGEDSNRIYVTSVDGSKNVGCFVTVTDPAPAPAPSASIDFKGGSLRRRVYRGTTDVIDFETDIRFGFEFTLPEGATINMSDSYFCWKNNSVATAEDGNKVTIQSVDTSGEKPVANLILTGVPKAYYTTNIFCFVHVEYTLNEQVYTIETVEPYSRSVKEVCDSLVEDTTAPELWRNYAQSLLDAIK